MADIHPLVKMVEQVLSAQPQNATYADLSRAAIRAVLTFEPSNAVLFAGYTATEKHGNADTHQEVAKLKMGPRYRAMTAALLKDVEDGEMVNARL